VDSLLPSTGVARELSAHAQTVLAGDLITEVWIGKAPELASWGLPERNLRWGGSTLPQGYYFAMKEAVSLALS
jgi:hypothetical protein